MAVKTKPVALVTGGAKRVGRGIVQNLAQVGFDIALHFNQSQHDAIKLKTELERDSASDVSLFQADLAEPDSVHQLGRAVSQHYEHVDLLVNCASYIAYDSPKTFDPELALTCYKINTIAPIILSKLLTNPPKPLVIVNILDNKVVAPIADCLSYGLSKAALQYATQAMAASLGQSARVCGIAPGITLPSGHQTQAEFERMWTQNPCRQGASIEDICRAIDFFYQSKSVSGQIVTIDGGESLLNTLQDLAFKTE